MKSAYNKSKGFSLVELLAVIVILGIISGVAIFGVNKYFKNVRINYYSSQEKMVVNAGKEYFTDNKNKLPREIGKSTVIYLSDLVNNNYTKNIVDYTKSTCNTSKSYIKVQKIDANKYSYEAYLNCPDYATSEEKDNGNNTISIVLNKEINNKPTATVNINEKNGIASYSYIIYQNNKEYKNTGNLNNADNTKSLNFTVKFEDFEDGKYSIKVNSIDTFGNETSKSSNGTVLIDKTGPVCGATNGSSTTWTNQNRTISIACNDTGSGCKLNGSNDTNIYSKTFISTMKTGDITLYDNYGNSTKCNVNVYIDKDKPTCGDNNGSTTWTNQNRTISLKCNDVGSGCSKNIYSNTFTSTLKNSNYTISDKAGNSTTCPINVYIDKTGPSKPTVNLNVSSTAGNGQTCELYSSGNWTNKTVNILNKSSDDYVGINRYQYSHNNVDWMDIPSNWSRIYSNNNETINWSIWWEGQWNFYVRAVDNLGNVGTSSNIFNIKIDKTPPSISLTMSSRSNSYNTTNINYSIKASDNSNGSIKYCFNASDNNNCTPNITLASKNDVYIGASYNGVAVTRRACAADLAGNINCSSYIYTPYKYCESKTTSGNWYDMTSCSKLCGTGTKKQSQNLVDYYITNHSCGTKSQTVNCNTQSCCSSVKDSGSWYDSGECSESCGGGSQLQKINQVSKYDGSSCGTRSQNVSCNTQSCCSDSNPTACTALYACRSGKTMLYDQPSSDSYIATVEDTTPLYELGRVDGFIRVYAKEIAEPAYAWSGDKHIGYIYDYCVSEGGECSYDQCPDLY